MITRISDVISGGLDGLLGNDIENTIFTRKRSHTMDQTIKPNVTANKESTDDLLNMFSRKHH